VQTKTHRCHPTIGFCDALSRSEFYPLRRYNWLKLAGDNLSKTSAQKAFVPMKHI
jgi:hypothetical protein